MGKSQDFPIGENPHPHGINYVGDSMFYMPPPPPASNKAAIRAALVALDMLTDEERMEVFGEYCQGCGEKNPHCQCRNDE